MFWIRRFYQTQAFDIDSGERNQNTFRGSYKLFFSPFFPSQSNWFKGDPKRQFRIQWVWRPKTSTNRLGDPRRDIAITFKSSMYLGIGATDYKRMVRNDGA